MLLLSLSASRLFSPATHPTHPTCALVCGELPLGWPYSFYLCLWCCSELTAVATAFHSKNQSGPVNQLSLGIFAMVVPLLPKSVWFKSDRLLPRAVDRTSGFRYLLYSVSHKHFPSPPKVGSPIQCYHSVYPNGGRLDEPSLESSTKIHRHVRCHMTTHKLQSGYWSICLWICGLWW